LSNGQEKIKLQEEAISEILVADTDSESGAEVAAEAAAAAAAAAADGTH